MNPSGAGPASSSGPESPLQEAAQPFGACADGPQPVLTRASVGDPAATRQLFAQAYDQLKRLARGQRRRVGGSPLHTTSLVHETFLKLARRGALDVRERSHFLSIAALAMRQILVDHARRELARKRGGGRPPISFHEIEEALEAVTELSPERAEALLALDESLQRLAQRSERHRRVVECRFFAGMSIRETAQALDSSPATVKRDWVLAQAWLLRDLEERR